MLLSQISLLVIRASEEAEELAVSPLLIFAIAFVILMLLLGATVAFGGGRDHS